MKRDSGCRGEAGESPLLPRRSFFCGGFYIGVRDGQMFRLQQVLLFASGGKAVGRSRDSRSSDFGGGERRREGV